MGITKSKVMVWSCTLILVVIGICAGYTWITLNWSFSKGERAGYVQKFSHKGWLCKTWEGELQMIPVPGATPEKFLFTVRDDETARKVNAAVGKKVSLHYEEHKGVPTRCFGETGHFVTGIKVFE